MGAARTHACVREARARTAFKLSHISSGRAPQHMTTNLKPHVLMEDAYHIC